MADNLIIIESPKKAKVYNKALGPDYEVVSSYGHCIDLPIKKLGINIKKDFDATFEIMEDKINVVQTIRQKAKKAKSIYLMPDPDREGEAIAWHISNEIKNHTKAKIYRATANEMTATAIVQAVNNPTEIDMHMIDAYLCRRLLDRLCGYKTSYLTQQATGGKSAGRVQSAVLRIIVEREKEIIAFVPEEYWIITAFFISSKGDPYVGVLDSKVKVRNEKQATKIYDAVRSGSYSIKSVDRKQVDANPFAPFTTSALIQAGSSIFNWGSKKTMKTAQSLYESGHITYMRTDSPMIANVALNEIREYIGHEHGDDYLPKVARQYSAKKGAQEGHECCRPTDIHVADPSGGDDEKKLYKMIWKRVVSSQMNPGRDEQIRVVTKVATSDKDYDFVSAGKTRLFDGYRKVWNYSNKEDVLLPTLKQGEKCTLENLKKEQKFTSPPGRYTEGSITKSCEKQQIGRPSTYAQCVQTLLNRNYVQKSGKSLQATGLGISVIDFLIESDFCFVDIAFTAQMESMLDEIAGGGKLKLDVLTEFWTRLRGDIEKGKEIKLQRQITEHPCPKCNAKLMKKHSRFGPFYACEKYKAKKKDGSEPEGSCNYTAQVGKKGEPVEKPPPKPKEYADFPCTKCSARMVKRSSSHGEFFGCEKYPKCKTIASLEGVFSTGKKKYKKKNG